MIVIPGALFAAWWLFLRPPEYASFPNTPDAVFVFVRQSWVALTAAVSRAVRRPGGNPPSIKRRPRSPPLRSSC